MRKHADIRLVLFPPGDEWFEVPLTIPESLRRDCERGKRRAWEIVLQAAHRRISQTLEERER